MHRVETWFVAAVAASLALASVACTSDTHVTVDQGQQTGIAVNGTGSVTVVPDIGLVSIGVEVTRPTVADARAEAAGSIDAVRASLQQNGVADNDIATQFFNIQPQYGNPQPVEGPGTPTITGYTVTNTLNVEVRQLDTISAVVDGAVSAGGNAVRVNNVSFVVDQPERYQTEARNKAVADARAKAEQLAQLAGVDLGDARAVTEIAGSNPPEPRLASAASQGAADTSLSPGQTEVTLTVSVIYDLK
jgi:uncharacterized protein YggE